MRSSSGGANLESTKLKQPAGRRARKRAERQVAPGPARSLPRSPGDARGSSGAGGANLESTKLKQRAGRQAGSSC
eukprot:tig00020510_g9950.t1